MGIGGIDADWIGGLQHETDLERVSEPYQHHRAGRQVKVILVQLHINLLIEVVKELWEELTLTELHLRHQGCDILGKLL